MLQLTRDGEYAVRAVLYLAAQAEGKISLVNEISESQGVPKSYLSKIMQHLTKAGIVRSRRGAKGGFFLAKSAKDITLKDTIEAIEGPIHLNICLIKKGECQRDEVCPVHPVWREAQIKLLEILESKNMSELVSEAAKLQTTAHKAKQGLKK